MTLIFKPCAGDHSIEACMITIRFAQAVEPEAFTQIIDQAQQIATANNLPARQQIPAIIFGFGPQGPLTPSVTPSVFASFQRFAQNGQVAMELKCEAQALILHVREYTRWHDLITVVDSTLLKILPHYLKLVPAISAVLLQYEDRFVGPVGDVAVDEIFNPSTRWVNLNGGIDEQPWHSHFGMFSSPMGNSRELINVNVDVADQPLPNTFTPPRSVRLLILVGKMYDLPNELPLILEENEVRTAVNTILERLHSRQKEILSNILSHSYLNAIGIRDSQ